MSDQKYTYTVHTGKEESALIKLGIHALGGTDALNFTGILNEISKTQVKKVILDLSAVEIMNSSGLGMLVSGLSTLKKYNIGLSLAALPKKVDDLMKMTRLDTIFKIYPSVESALNL